MKNDTISFNLLLDFENEKNNNNNNGFMPLHACVIHFAPVYIIGDAYSSTAGHSIRKLSSRNAMEYVLLARLWWMMTKAIKGCNLWEASKKHLKYQ